MHTECPYKILKGNSLPVKYFNRHRHQDHLDEVLIIVLRYRHLIHCRQHRQDHHLSNHLHYCRRHQRPNLHLLDHLKPSQ